MSLFIQSAYASTAGTAPSGGSMIAQLAMPLLFVAIFYFFIIRPQSKRNKEHQAMVNSLSEGTEVIFAGGLLGRVEAIDGDYAVISLNKNNQIKIQKTSVLSVLPKGTLENLA